MSREGRAVLAVLAVAALAGLTAGCPSPSESPSDSADGRSGPRAVASRDVAPQLSLAPQDLQSAGADSQPLVDPQPLRDPQLDEAQPESDSQPTDEAVGDGKPAAESERKPLDLESWPQPRAALLITGQQHGYIEPCGCTGLANQKGGLMRRHTFFKQLAAKGWDLVPMDVGNQVRRSGPQPQAKYSSTLQSLQMMDYQAIAYGPDDLRLSSGELLAAALNWEGESPFVCCNMSILDSTPAHRVITAGGLKIGVTGVLGEAERKELAHIDEAPTMPPSDGLDRAWQELRQKECDVYVLLAHASVEETRELVRKHPHFDIVVTTGYGEPTLKPERVEGAKSQIVQCGIKGMYAGVIGLYDSSPRIRYEYVALDARFDDSPDIVTIFKNYQDRLKSLGLRGLAVQPIPHPSGRTFVGTETCAGCHTQAMAVWQTTPHAHATHSIEHPPERAEIPRHYDPECLSCHVTGWNPQKFFPYTSGYENLEKSAHLHHNGCENCHGPGSEHVAVEMGDKVVDEETQNKLRREMRLTLADAKDVCLECHDLDNSPDFDFEKYWPEVEHKGKD